MNICQATRIAVLKKLNLKRKEVSVTTHYKGHYCVEVLNKPPQEICAHCKDCAIVDCLDWSAVTL